MKKTLAIIFAGALAASSVVGASAATKTEGQFKTPAVEKPASSVTDMNEISDEADKWNFINIGDCEKDSDGNFITDVGTLRVVNIDENEPNGDDPHFVEADESIDCDVIINLDDCEKDDDGNYITDAGTICVVSVDENELNDDNSYGVETESEDVQETEEVEIVVTYETEDGLVVKENITVEAVKNEDGSYKIQLDDEQITEIVEIVLTYETEDGLVVEENITVDAVRNEDGSYTIQLGEIQ